MAASEGSSLFPERQTDGWATLDKGALARKADGARIFPRTKIMMMIIIISATI